MKYSAKNRIESSYRLRNKFFYYVILFNFIISIFSMCSKEYAFEKTNAEYDFSKLRIITNLGNIEVESIDIKEKQSYKNPWGRAKFQNNQIILAKSEGNLRDDVYFDRRENNFHFDGMYRIRKDGKIFYFRSGYQWFHKDRTYLLWVYWIDNKYPETEGKMYFDVVSVPLIQKGSVSITTVGDSITWAHYGQYYRYKLWQLNTNYRFIGSRTDIFGFGHEGEGGDVTPYVLKRMDDIVPNSQNYILLIGANDIKLDSFSFEKTFNNIVTIVNKLKDKNRYCRIFVCTILPCNSEIFVNKNKMTIDDYNQKVNVLLRKKYSSGSVKRVTLINTEKLFRSKKNYLDLLFWDGLHPNHIGYGLLAQEVHKYIDKQ